MRRLIGLVLGGAVTLGLGCAGSKTPAPSDMMQATMEREDAAGGQHVKEDAPARAPEPEKKPVEKPRRRMIVYTGRVELVADDYDAARYRMMELLREYDGYEAKSEQTGQPNQTRRGVWTLRVPAEQFRGFLDALVKLGEERRRTIESNDISDRYYDVQAETINLEAREKALRKLYEEKIAGSKLADLIEVDRELSNVRGQINVRKGQMQRWEAETAFATITVELWSRQGYVPPTAPDFGTAIGRTFASSVDAMATFGKGVVLFVVAVGPWVLLASVVLVPAWLVRSLLRRRAKVAPPAGS